MVVNDDYQILLFFVKVANRVITILRLTRVEMARLEMLPVQRGPDMRYYRYRDAEYCGSTAYNGDVTGTETPG